MTATIIGSLIILVLVALAIRHMIKSHKSGGCCSDCKGCSGCNLTYEEVKKEIPSQK